MKLIILVILLNFITYMLNATALKYNSHNKDLIYTERLDGTILILDIKDGSKTYVINTNASVVHNYKLSQISKRNMILNSSDIGTYIITNELSNKWDIYPASHTKSKNINIYVIFPKDSEYVLYRDDSGRQIGKSIYTSLDILFEKDGNTKNFKLDGIFPTSIEKYRTIKDNSFLMESENDYITFDIDDNLEKITYKKKRKINK